MANFKAWLQSVKMDKDGEYRLTIVVPQVYIEPMKEVLGLTDKVLEIEIKEEISITSGE